MERERERQPRGRPRDRWSISGAALPGGDPPRAYADLGRWLVRALASGDADLASIEATGREIGREIAPEPDARSAERRMHGVLVAMGFKPEARAGADGEMDYCLGNCPYRAAARERQPVVCSLHRGITQGLLDAIDPQTELSRFVPKDPDEAGCLIGLRGPMADDIDP